MVDDCCCEVGDREKLVDEELLELVRVEAEDTTVGPSTDEVDNRVDATESLRDLIEGGDRCILLCQVEDDRVELVRDSRGCVEFAELRS